MRPFSAPSTVGHPYPRGHTPFPSHLVDEVMPTLRDTEWRLLCVIVRQTLGWQEGYTGQRKTRDWLTHSQLKARTGRSSEALSHAVDTLVRRDLIEVQDETGTPLLTPQDRQRCLGRLYFRLSPRALNGRHREPTETEAGREAVSQKDALPRSESEIRKAKTTKETVYKYTYATHREVIHRQAVDNSGLSQAQRRALAKQEELRLPARRLLSAYLDKMWQAGRVARLPIVILARDEPLVMELLTHCSYECLDALLDRFVVSEKEWIREQGYSLVTFHRAVRRWLASKSPANRMPPVGRSAALDERK